MRVLILNQFFYPDHSATSQLMTDLAEDLTGLGAEVTVVCGRSTYAAQAGDSLERCQPVRILRVWSSSFERGSLWKRAMSYLSFYVAAFWRCLFLSRQDVVIALTTPPLIATVACVVQAIKGGKVVYLVQDLYPDIAFQLGLLARDSLFAKLLERISRWTLRRADAVVVLGECMRQRVEVKGVPGRKIHVIQNWADGSQIRSVDKAENTFLGSNGLEGRFVVQYSGNMGNAHDLDTILEAARRLGAYPDIVFLFIGDGPRRPVVERFAADHPESHVRLLPYAAQQDLSYSLSAADASLVSLASGLEGLVVPSKLYGIMASGRPVLYVGPEGSEAAATVRDHECGFVIRNGDAKGLKQAILQLQADAELGARMGHAARAALDGSFERRRITRRYFDLLQGLVDARPERASRP